MSQFCIVSKQLCMEQITENRKNITCTEYNTVRGIIVIIYNLPPDLFVDLFRYVRYNYKCFLNVEVRVRVCNSFGSDGLTRL